MDDLPTHNKSLILTPLLIILLLVIGASGYYYISISYPTLFADITTSVKSSPQPKQEETLLPRPPIRKAVALEDGPRTYKFSHGDQVVGPRISELTMNPLNNKEGENQTLTIKATHPLPITNVTIELITDNKIVKHELKLIEGSATDGVWQTNWQSSDTHSGRYGLRLFLESSDNNYDNVMMFI